MNVSCKNCHWSQDDFWDKDYNPYKCAANDEADFLKSLGEPDARNRLMCIDWLRDTGMKGTPVGGGRYLVDARDMMIHRFEQLLKRVKGMKWWTYAEFDAERIPTCPTCGSNQLSVD